MVRDLVHRVSRVLELTIFLPIKREYFLLIAVFDISIIFNNLQTALNPSPKKYL